MAAAHGLARRSGKEPVIYIRRADRSAHSAKDYKNSIFQNWRQVSDSEVDFLYNEAEHDPCNYVPIPVPEPAKHLHLHGYFQNEKYISDWRSEFMDSLDLTVGIPCLPQTCFIHVRKGDYVGNVVHEINLFGEYLPRAMTLMRALHPGLAFLVFSDDIPFCKELAVLKTEDVLFYEETDEVIALVQMSKCLLGGICWNSSYSWWGAYLNDNPDKTVIFPSRWFNNNWKIDIQFKTSIIIKV